MHIVGDLFILFGAIFIFLGAIGLLRMPDVYNRIQVGTKAVTLGAIGVLFGLFIIHPEWGSKLLVILGFTLLTSPVSSSAITRAFYRSGVKVWTKKEQQENNAKEKES